MDDLELKAEPKPKFARGTVGGNVQAEFPYPESQDIQYQRRKAQKPNKTGVINFDTDDND